MGLQEFDQLAKSYGVTLAILLGVCLGELYFLRVLWVALRETQQRLSAVLEERSKALESLLSRHS